MGDIQNETDIGVISYLAILRNNGINRYCDAEEKEEEYTDLRRLIETNTRKIQTDLPTHNRVLQREREKDLNMVLIHQNKAYN